MKIKVRRTVLLILLGVILFSAAMAIPALYHSKWKDLMQGGAVGLLIAGSISIVKILLEYKKGTK
ncbi:MAG TPA: hypothetical protein VGC01_02885 [Mucilaginibacter sp.]